MDTFRLIAKPVSRFLILCMLGLGLHWPVAYAGIVTTESVLAHEQGDPDRARVRDFLARADVRAELMRLGVDPAEVRGRVDGLTDAEVQTLTGKLDQLPAGGDSAGAILLVGLIVFLVLLYTDIMGYTDIFPFVKKKKQ